MLYKKVIRLFAFCLLIQIAANGQSPENNIPQADSPTINTPAEYPGLINLNVTGALNYVQVITPDQAMQSLPSSGYKYRQQRNYFDGLGRHLQSVTRRGHADGYDIIQPFVYDALGRERYQYLPFAYKAPLALNLGNIRLDVATSLRGFYEEAGPDEPPYSRTDFEASALARPLKDLSPGKGWVGSDRGVTENYTFNVANEVWVWKIGTNNTDLPVNNGYYGAGELHCTVTTDEDGHLTKEFKDKEGNVILRKVLESTATPDYGHTGYACTYYVYDDLKRLRYIIPPQAVYNLPNPIDLTDLKEYCFSYFYDERGRLIEKKIPGKELEEFVYDKRDRLVLSRDGNLRNRDKWAFTFYDALDRPLATGLTAVLSGSTRSSLSNDIANGYQGYPTSHFYYYLTRYDLFDLYPTVIQLTDFLTYTYYDDYEQLSAFSYDASQFSGELPTPTQTELVPPALSNLTHGMVTGTKKRVMDEANPTAENWLTTVNYYDDQGRILQSQSQNANGGLDIASNLYYFQGMLGKTILKHNNPKALAIPNASDGAIQNYRLVKTYKRNVANGGGNDLVWQSTQTINGGPIYNIANYDYDHLNRVVVKDYAAGIQLNTYNMRGFLTGIYVEDRSESPYLPIFSERLRYDWGFQKKNYNGNISGILWSGADNRTQAYGYSYDKLDRLTHAEYRYSIGGSSWNKTDWDYTASNITYDLNGNLKSMDQRGGNYPGTPMDMDKLVYDYAPGCNRLKAVEDNGTEIPGLPDFRNRAKLATEYGYDANGNITADSNKKIRSIVYNYLNKPGIITSDSGIIRFVYDAGGNCLRKIVTPNAGEEERYDYFGNFVYKNDVLQYILNEEGRARPVANAETVFATRFIYDYFIKDHLGNVRTTITAEPINPVYLAKHEIATAAAEQLVFDNIPNVRDAKPESTDPYDGMAARLEGSNPDTRVGTAILLKTMPGDKFTISSKYYYNGNLESQETTGAEPLLESLMGALMGGSTYAGIPVSELPENVRTVGALLNNSALPGMIRDLQVNDDPTAPKAHLNYLFFNDKMELVAPGSGAIQVQPGINGWGSTGAVNIGGSSNLSEPVISGPGFLLVYIDNQSIGKDVWFDDVHIEHYTSKILEESHYYPYGLTVGIDQAAQNNLPSQPYKFNGKELNREFGLESYNFGDRFYDSQVGRWNGVDNSAESYDDISTYSFVGGNPIRRADIDGNDWRDKIMGEIVAVVDNVAGLDYRDRYTPNDVRDYKNGQFLGDLYSLIGGTIEGGSGGGMVNSSVAVTVGSGGLALEVTAPVAALGTAMTVHGTMTAARAMDNLKSEASNGTPAVGKKLEKSNVGRSGKQSRLKELGNDPKVSSADRGWIKQEVNQIERGKRKSIRNPGNKDLAHKRGKEAAKGFSYKEADLQTKELHRLQHKYDNFGRKNKKAVK